LNVQWEVQEVTKVVLFNSTTHILDSSKTSSNRSNYILTWSKYQCEMVFICDICSK